MKWISIEDRLPKHDVVIGWVKLSTGSWAARDGFMNPDGYTFWMNEHHTNLSVTHWMPLPGDPAGHPEEVENGVETAEV